MFVVAIFCVSKGAERKFRYHLVNFGIHKVIEICGIRFFPDNFHFIQVYQECNFSALVDVLF